MTAAIDIERVSKRFRINANKSLKEHVVRTRQTRSHTQDFWALRDVSMSIEHGTTLGLIGHNGSGKSTLLKTIGGILTPTSGRILRRGRVAALLELGAGFQGDLTGRENVYLNASILGLSQRQTRTYFDTIVDFSGIDDFIDTPVKFYSSGMYVRLAFSVAVHVEPEILLVDEVLSVGDEAFQRKCLHRIAEFQREGRTILFVTHGLDLVREICDRAVLLDHGKVAFDGDPVAAVRKIRDDFEELAQSYERELPLAEEGTGSARIGRVSILDADGRACERFRPYEPLTIEFTVSATGPLDDWAVGVAIENQFDQLCFGQNSAQQGLHLGRLTGEHVVRFDIPTLNLADGNYHITVAVHPERGPEYHRRSRVGRFRVTSPAQVGPVFLEPRIAAWPVDDLEPVVGGGAGTRGQEGG
jgi:ABC-2 type transport system ATP-binding protein